MNSLTLSMVRTTSGMQVHYANSGFCLASRGLDFYSSSDSGVNWRRLTSIPAPPSQRWLTLFAPYQRLVRGGINIALPWNQSMDTSSNLSTSEAAAWIAMSGGAIYKVSNNGQSVRPIWDLRNGRRTLYRGMAVAGSYLFICDYWPNPQRVAANIYRINLATEEAEIFYQFEAGSVRHVHNVEVDPVSGKLWSSTGDADHECQISQLDLATGTREIIGEGSQQWRAVSFVFRNDAVYWGTDDPDGTNQIWRYDRKSCKLQQIGTVKGPVYYSKNTQDFVLFCTAVEDGTGQQDGYGRLYAAQVAEWGQQLGTDAITLNEVLRQPKDGWHSRYFGYGLSEFNAGDMGHNQFWATSKGFKGGLRSSLFQLRSGSEYTQPRHN